VTSTFEDMVPHTAVAPSRKRRRRAIGEDWSGDKLRIIDFVAYMPNHSYIFVPTGETWVAASVNARVPPIMGQAGKSMSATAWLDTYRAVEQMTWAPGEPSMIKGRLIADGGWKRHENCTVLNLYAEPTIARRPGPVDLWLNHIGVLYPSEADHIVAWLAHRVQRPQEKINHALVLGGDQGIGKDTILEPVKYAVGPWNFHEVSPQQLLGRFNGFVRSVILRVSEARDLGDSDRFSFYDRMKVYTAAPPDVLRVDEKFRCEYYVLNVCGVVITSNHKADGIHLPADDRRHFVAWSDRCKEDFPDTYWQRLYDWYANGGHEAVADYLADLDISAFNPKAPPPKTQAFWEIVNASRAPEDAELADALDRLHWPDVITLDLAASAATDSFAEWLRDRRNARKVPHRMEECGYVPVRNCGATDGRWKINGRRQAVYGKRELNERERQTAASRLTGGSS